MSVWKAPSIHFCRRPSNEHHLFDTSSIHLSCPSSSNTFKLTLQSFVNIINTVKFSIPIATDPWNRAAQTSCGANDNRFFHFSSSFFSFPFASLSEEKQAVDITKFKEKHGLWRSIEYRLIYRRVGKRHFKRLRFRRLKWNIVDVVELLKKLFLRVKSSSWKSIGCTYSVFRPLDFYFGCWCWLLSPPPSPSFAPFNRYWKLIGPLYMTHTIYTI